MRVKTEIYSFPTFWACYLINGDLDNITNEEKNQIDQKVKGLGHCVSVSEDSNFGTFAGLGCDLSEYTFAKYYHRTIDKIICPVSSKYGAQIGRANIGTRPKDKRVYDCAIPLNDGYDSGGVYWGLGPQLRVSYTKDLSYIEFYRSKH